MDKGNILAIASLIGTIIGAGIFAIPFVMSKSGILPNIFYFIILGTIVLLLNLFLGEVALRTKARHRLSGYVEKYLGKKAKIFVMASTIIGAIGSLLAYIILSGKFLSVVSPFLFPWQWSIIVWALLSCLILFGIETIAPIEVFMNAGLFLVIFIIFAASFGKVQANNFHIMDLNYAFLPIGVILFSLVGWNAVPGVIKLLKNKKDLKKVIIITIAVVVCFYFLFGLIISGVTGTNTTQEAFKGLTKTLGNKITLLGSLFGLLAVFTSYLILGNYLKNTLIFDCGISKYVSFALASFAPLALFLLGMQDFILVISIIGIFIGFIEGTSIVLIYKKAKKLGDKTPNYNLSIPDFVFYLIILILGLGVLSQIIYG